MAKSDGHKGMYYKRVRWLITQTLPDPQSGVCSEALITMFNMAMGRRFHALLSLVQIQLGPASAEDINFRLVPCRTINLPISSVNNVQFAIMFMPQ